MLALIARRLHHANALLTLAPHASTQRTRPLSRFACCHQLPTMTTRKEPPGKPRGRTTCPHAPFAERPDLPGRPVGQRGRRRRNCLGRITVKERLCARRPPDAAACLFSSTAHASVSTANRRRRPAPLKRQRKHALTDRRPHVVWLLSPAVRRVHSFLAVRTSTLHAGHRPLVRTWSAKQAHPHPAMSCLLAWKHPSAMPPLALIKRCWRALRVLQMRAFSSLPDGGAAGRCCVRRVANTGRPWDGPWHGQLPAPCRWFSLSL